MSLRVNNNERYNGINVNGQFHNADKVFSKNSKKEEIELKELDSNGKELVGNKEAVNNEKQKTISEKATTFFSNIKNDAKAKFSETKQEVNKVVSEFTDANKGNAAHEKIANKIDEQNENLKKRVQAERAEIRENGAKRFGVKREYQKFVPGNGTFSTATNFYGKLHTGIEKLADTTGQAAGATIHAVTRRALTETVGNLFHCITTTEDNRVQRSLERTALNAGIATEFVVKNSIRILHIASPILTLIAGGISIGVAAVVIATSPFWIAAAIVHYIDKKEINKNKQEITENKQEINKLNKKSDEQSQKIDELSKKIAHLIPIEKVVVEQPKIEEVVDFLDIQADAKELPNLNEVKTKQPEIDFSIKDKKIEKLFNEQPTEKVVKNAATIGGILGYFLNGIWDLEEAAE